MFSIMYATNSCDLTEKAGGKNLPSLNVKTSLRQVVEP